MHFSKTTLSPLPTPRILSQLKKPIPRSHQFARKFWPKIETESTEYRNLLKMTISVKIVSGTVIKVALNLVGFSVVGRPHHNINSGNS